MKRILSGILAGLLTCLLLVPASAASKDTTDPNVRIFSGAAITLPNTSNSVTNYYLVAGPLVNKNTVSSFTKEYSGLCSNCNAQTYLAPQSIVNAIRGQSPSVCFCGTDTNNLRGSINLYFKIGSNTLKGTEQVVYNVSGTYLSSGNLVKLNRTTRSVSYSPKPSARFNNDYGYTSGSDNMYSYNYTFDLPDFCRYFPIQSLYCLTCGSFVSSRNDICALPSTAAMVPYHCTLYMNNLLHSESDGTVAVIAAADRLYGVTALQPGTVLPSSSKQQTATLVDYSLSPIAGETARPIELKNCTSSVTLNSAFNGAVPVTINGGNYSGAPALQSGMITVNKGMLTDNSGTKSTYIVGEDSEASSTTSGNTTVTQVKLSNPPVTINWDDFPMPDLSAPVISVTRSPSNSKEPCTEVQLTITAKDPDGNDSETPISIDGGAFQASPATYTVTENGTVDIVARDANGNTRNFSVNITNIDSEAPTVNGFHQSNTNWTKDPVRVTVNATDDVKLDDNPYKWSFTPNSTGVKETGNWTSEKSIKVNESGTLQVLVRDKLGHETLSDEYQVTNIDRIAPAATVNLSPDASHEASRDTGVRAELSFNNLTDPVTDLASPIADVGVLWDDSEGWTENTAKTFKENGVYYVKVRDSVGNISDPIQFTINNISTSLPVIDAFETTSMGAEYVQAPVDLKVTAHATGSSTLPARPYSWDGGRNWTSQSSLKITENGEYLVTVRDSVGNTAEASIVVNNIDPVAPTVGVYVYKGLPSDGSGAGPDDYVWKVRVEADDVGSGVDHVETLWDSGTHSTLPVIQDIEEPGIYGAIVYDKAGNKSYAEKVVTAESIGESAGTANGSYVDIKVPSGGSAGSYFNAAIQDLVYGPSGAYNKQTDSFKAYNGTPQIEAHVTASAKSSRYLTGYATFNSVKYPLDFGGGADGIAGGKNLPVTVTIPLSTITSDVKNGRLTIMLQEYDDSSKTTLVREGSATLYTSVQVNAPKLTYSYNAATDELLVNGSSAVAGIKAVGAKLDGGAMQTSFPLAVSSASSIEMVVQDKVMQETSIVVSLSDLKLNGSAGGILPTETLTDKSINSYMTTSRNGTTFIINGSQSNTDQIPAKELFEQIMA